MIGFIAIVVIMGVVGFLCFHKSDEDDPKEGESTGGGCITALIFGVICALIFFFMAAIEGK